MHGVAPPSSPVIPLPSPSPLEQEQAAAFRTWMQQHGGKATREPQAFMDELTGLRQRVESGEALPAPAEVHRAGLDLAEAVARHRLANHATVSECAERARAVFDRVARETGSAPLAHQLHFFSANCSIQEGNACHGRARYADALRAYGTARERLALLGERKGESTVLRNMGLCYEASGLLHLAVESALAARDIAREIGRAHV